MLTANRSVCHARKAEPALLPEAGDSLLPGTARKSGVILYIATEIVASGFGVGEAWPFDSAGKKHQLSRWSAQRPEHTHQYVRSASTTRPRPRVAHNQ